MKHLFEKIDEQIALKDLVVEIVNTTLENRGFFSNLRDAVEAALNKANVTTLTDFDAEVRYRAELGKAAADLAKQS